MGGLSGADVGMLVAAGAVVVFAIVYALARGDRRDPLERLAAWAHGHGLEYVAAESDLLVAAFVGERDGQRAEVSVARVGRGFGEDLPTRLTTVTVGAAVDEAAVAPMCVIQPAAWVLDRDGHHVGERVPTGDEAFDAKWSARGPDAAGVTQCLSPAVRARLLEADAGGLIVELFRAAVAIPMPGYGADARNSIVVWRLQGISAPPSWFEPHWAAGGGG